MASTNIQHMTDEQLQAELERQQTSLDAIEAEQTRRRHQRVASACKGVFAAMKHLSGAEQLQTLELAKSQIKLIE